MNKSEKIISQTLLLGFVAVSTILFADFLDAKNYMDNTSRIALASVSSPITYTINDVADDNEKIVHGEIDHIDGIPARYEAQCETVFCPNEKAEDRSVSMEIPCGDCSNMMYMDFRTLTNTSSKQWELQQYAWTDSQGFRRIGDDYCVALGTYYGQVGDRFRITTDRGNVYTVIEADAKGYDAVSYDGYYTWYHVCGDGRINVVEFVVDTYCLDGYALTMGDCNVIDNIGGDVISIERLVDWE